MAKRWLGFATFRPRNTSPKRTFDEEREPGRSVFGLPTKPFGGSGLEWDNVDKSRVGIYVGVTEHGNVETENEIYQIKGFDYDTQFWSHHHNPRTVANNPAGEVALNMGVTGPHYTIGAACAAGNTGIVQGADAAAK
ncbi:MAG: beta-ketoacyl synthase N-terminal-like domain-containing protein [Pirellulaceae bacterium]